MLNPVVVPWKGATIMVHASFGVQSYGGDTDADADGAQLLSRADASMYQTKYLRAHDNRPRMSA
jgi:GGDEF domain-containing protein